MRAFRHNCRRRIAWLSLSSPGTPECRNALFRVLSPKRWELLERLQALGPSSLRGLARSLERDVKRVHEDVGTLIEVGLIEKAERGKIHVPYSVIEADFALRAA